MKKFIIGLGLFCLPSLGGALNVKLSILGGVNFVRSHVKDPFLKDLSDEDKEFYYHFDEESKSFKSVFSQVQKEENADSEVSFSINTGMDNKKMSDISGFGGFDLDFQGKDGDWFGGVKIGGMYLHASPEMKMKLDVKAQKLKEVNAEIAEYKTKTEEDQKKVDDTIFNSAEKKQVDEDDAEWTAAENKRDEISAATDLDKNKFVKLENKKYGILPYIGVYGGKFLSDNISVLGGIAITGKANKAFLNNGDGVVEKDLPVSFGPMPFIQLNYHPTEYISLGLGIRGVVLFDWDSSDLDALKPKPPVAPTKQAQASAKPGDTASVPNTATASMPTNTGDISKLEAGFDSFVLIYLVVSADIV